MDEIFPDRKPFDAQQMCTRHLVPAGQYALSKSLPDANPNLSAFSMETYPVTVARYAHFIDQGGYFSSEWWSQEGWSWRVDHNMMAPRFWDDPNWQHLRKPVDRPVVGVSWYEADAFCRFEEGVLPTEAQWEAAARGRQGFQYPWGNVWEKGRVGNRGVGPKNVWQIGYWPQACGPLGHHDLVANVWQWTCDLWPIKQEDTLMVVRGGSWASREEMCRTHVRNGYAPWGQWSHVGFRVAYPENLPQIASMRKNISK